MKIGFDFSWSGVLTAVWIAIGLIFAVLMYRRTVPPAPRWLRSVMAGLRFLTWILWACALGGLALRMDTIGKEKPVVALLLDNSVSMTISENGRTRAETVRSFLSSQEFRALSRQCLLRPYRFSDRCVMLDSWNETTADSLVWDGPSTDIARALQTIHDEEASAPLRAALVVTDGRRTAGENPVRIGENLGFPVLSVVVGDPRRKPDLILTRIVSNDIGFVGTRIPVDVALQGLGFSGRRVSVRMKTDWGEEEKTVVVGEDGTESVVRFTIVPTDPGLVTITAGLSRFEGELTHANNSRDATMRVLKSRWKVLFLGGRPSPDAAFLQRILQKDANVDLDARIVKDSRSLYKKPFPTEAEWDAADVLVLADVPNSFTPAPLWSGIVQAVSVRRKAFFLLLGLDPDLRRLRELGPFLGFDSPAFGSERPVLPRMTLEGENHAVMRIRDNLAESRDSWAGLPPVYTRLRSIRLRSGSVVLMEGMAENGMPDGSPLLLGREVVQEKSLVLFGTGIWRWEFLMRGMGENREMLTGFLSNALRWLALRESSKPLKIRTDRVSYSAGQSVFFEGQVFDDSFRPVENAIMALDIRSPGSLTRLVLNNDGHGHYRGLYQPAETGRMTAVGTVTVSDRIVGTDTVQFSVGSYAPEWIDTRSDPEEMERLARVSGGFSGPPDSLAALIRKMDLAPSVRTKHREWDFARNPGVLALLAAVLVLEWALRKRRGML